MILPEPKSPTRVTGLPTVDPTVVVIKTSPETVLEDIQQGMERAGIASALDKKATTILKDNISWHFPFPAANTTPWQLEGTILGLRRNGFSDLVCVQNMTVVTDAFKGEDLNKYVPLFRKYHIPVKFNFKAEDMKWVEFKPKTPLLVLDQIYPEGIRIPEYFLGKNIVHLPTVKCHIYTTTTGAMKNAFGGLLTTYRHYTHSWIHETLVDLLAIQKEIHTGIVAVMDGTTAGNGPGPRTMYPEEKNVVLVSSDQVAIDAVAAKLMGFDPLSIKYIRLAHERGLGCGDPRDIRIIGEDISNVNWRFSVGDNAASLAGDLLWFSPLRKFQNIFFRTPLVHLFIFGSEAYHDYYRWPLKDRWVFRQWLRSSQWGKLFASYDPPTRS
ncbi:MAG TPA: iron-sulfur cluster-binding protein [Bacteroidetes bacterium]|nr:iron-sulfur cluster-binding protein [Bacteroidota bacterium]